VKTDLLDYLQ